MDAIPEQLRTIVEKTKQETEANIRKELQFEMQLSKQEMNGKKELLEQKIVGLELKIQEQEQQILQLTEKANGAGQQVQEIAIKAIESTSYRRGMGGYVEVANPSHAPKSD
ncbi:MAG: hypothetical protein WB791_04005 [Waddliaceae bacterium]